MIANDYINIINYHYHLISDIAILLHLDSMPASMLHPRYLYILENADALESQFKRQPAR